jgi:hypothetical protein
MATPSLIRTVAGFIFIAGVTASLPIFGDSEKPGCLYLFGHWFDVLWELGIPLMCIGLFIFLVTFPFGARQKNQASHD